MLSYIARVNEICDQIDHELIEEFHDEPVAQADLNLLIACLHHVADRIINYLTFGVYPNVEEYNATLERVNVLIATLNKFEPTAVTL